MSKQYLHNRVSLSKDIHNLQPYRYKKDAEQLYAISASSNRLQLHRVLPDGLALENVYEFYADIARIQVLPSQFHDYDYVWILDKKGRYATWTPSLGLQFVHNLPVADLMSESHQSLFQNSNYQIFSGVTVFGESHEQTGSIFFAIGTQITVIEYSLKKQGCFLTEIHSETYSQQCKEIRFIDWITNPNDSKSLLGIIVETNAGTTVLQVYEIGRGYQQAGRKLAWSVQKKNLLQFYSPNSLQILLLSYDQIALYKYKQGALTCYRTGGNYGQGFYIGEGHYGQVGKQLIVFTKEKLIPFNNYRMPAQQLFQHAGLKQCTYLGHLQGVGAVLCLLTTSQQLYFLTINGQDCKICRLNQEIPVFESMKTFAEIKDTFAVVGRCRQEQYAIFLAEQIVAGRVGQWQQLQMKIDSLYTTVSGSYIIFSSANTSFVARVDKNNQYSLYFELPQGQILAIEDELLVTQQAIYEIDYQMQSYYKKEEADMLLAQIVNEVVFYLDHEGNIKAYNTQNRKTKVLAKDAMGDYCWATSKNTEMLICANLHHLTQLRLISQSTIEEIPVKGHTIISSMCTITPNKKRPYNHLGEINQKLVIGYSDGSIHLQSFEGHIVKIMKLTQIDRVIFTAMNPSEIIVRCGTRQYHLNCKGQSVWIDTVQLAHNITRIDHLVYLQKTQQFLIMVGNRLNNNSLLLRSSINNPNNVSHLTRLQNTFKSLPLITTSQHCILFALPHSLGKIDLINNNKTCFSSHELSQITVFQRTQRGLLLSGNHCSKPMLLVCNQQLQVMFRYVCSVSSPIDCLRHVQGTNQIMLWNDSTVSFHQLSPQTVGLKLLFGSNIGCRGYQSDICVQQQLLVLNDPQKCISLLSFADKISQVGRYVASRQILGCCFLDNDLLLLDESGSATLFSYDRDQFEKFTFNKQWNLSLNEVAAACCKHEGKIYYICQNGTIYSILQLETDTYQQLKPIQEENIHPDTNNFSYAQWRTKTKADRLIDAATLTLKTNDKYQPKEQQAQLLRRVGRW